MKIGRIDQAMLKCLWVGCVCILQSIPSVAQEKADGYKGIWFTLGQFSSYGDKYSGGLGTYTANHIPVAVYSKTTQKTFFVYGATSAENEKHLLIAISYFDHKKKQVPKPTIVYDKMGVNDPHDNASISIDDQGFIWVFVSGRNTSRPGLIFKSKQPYSIDGFTQINQGEMTYPQPWFIPGKGFFYLFTKYTNGRELYWRTSEDGMNWTQDQKLASALKAGAPTVISQLFAINPQAQLRSGELAGAMGTCPSSANPSSANVQQPFGTLAFGYMGAESMFAQSSASVGHITPVIDSDGNIRRVPAVVCFEGKAYPALAVAALSAATGVQPIWRQTQSGLFGASSAQLLDVGGLQLPLDHQGQLRVSYQMPRDGFVSVSAVDVLQGKVPPSMLKGAWVLVGSTAFGGGDAVPTPQGGAVGGVEVHAQLMSAALDARTPFVPAWAPLWPLQSVFHHLPINLAFWVESKV
ncbi:MAG: Adenylate cyclase 1 [Bacteroidota bacterium]